MNANPSADVTQQSSMACLGVNATQMADLIWASLFLKLDPEAFGALWVTALGYDRESFRAYFDTYSSFIATAKNTATSVAQAVQAAKLPSSIQAAGLTLSISQYLGSSPYEVSQFVAIPAAAAVQLGQSEAVFNSVLQVCNLQLLLVYNLQDYKQLLMSAVNLRGIACQHTPERTSKAISCF